MRMLLKVQVPADGGSQIPEDEWPNKLKQIMEQLKPEAAYFSPQDGMRTMMIFFDMQEVSMMPVVTKPLFEELDAKVTLSPAMNLDDLMTGLKREMSSR
jgi:hypothetical protein